MAATAVMAPAEKAVLTRQDMDRLRYVQYLIETGRIVREDEGAVPARGGETDARAEA